MRSSLFALLTLFALTLPVSACPPQTQANNPTQTTSQQESRTAVVWQRSGGIAGICQKLTLQSTGAYTIQDCIRETTLAQGRLSRSQFAQVNQQLNRYGSFEWQLQLPPNSADMFSENYTFNGKGKRTPSAREKEAINSQLAQLTTQLLQTRSQKSN